MLAIESEGKPGKEANGDGRDRPAEQIRLLYQERAANDAKPEKDSRQG